MLNVVGCITQQHDLRLVLLAGLLCLFACATAIGMILRARGAMRRMRLFWIFAAGTVAGCGIWGTHFVAMLAFRAGLPVTYDTGFTLLSVLIAAALCSVGFEISLRPRYAALGGALTGAAISAMHYVGMAAVRTPADAHWDQVYVVASVLIGVALSALAMHVTMKSRSFKGLIYGATLFTLAICGMHFTAMTAVTYVPNPTIVLPDAVLEPVSLAMAVAAGAILIVALGLIGVIVDNHLAHRAIQESARLRAYISELEGTKAQLEQTSAYLSEALRIADDASKAKSEFLAAMSHELRTPLNAVIGFSDVVLQEHFGPLGNKRYREYVENIRDSGAHLLGLINDVLDVSRLDAGQMALVEEVVQVADLADESIRMVALQANTAGVTVSQHIAPNIARVRMDRRRIRQVLLNLLTNSVKFTPAGGSVQVWARQEVGEFVIEVSDTGIGMSAEGVAKALERFGQIDSRLSRKYNGVGLGLPLAKQLTELHQGRLEVKSAPGAGTTVRIILPAERIIAEQPVRQVVNA